MSAGIAVRISPGELVDKITILEIKARRIGDPEKQRNVRIELEALERSRSDAIPNSARLDRLAADLKAVNETLWEIEDALRAHEKAGDFGPRFVELARSVYRTNDRRSALKREITLLIGSELIEEKSYMTD